MHLFGNNIGATTSGGLLEGLGGSKNGLCDFETNAILPQKAHALIRFITFFVFVMNFVPGVWWRNEDSLSLGWGGGILPLPAWGGGRCPSQEGACVAARVSILGSKINQF